MPTSFKVTYYDRTWSPRSLFHIQYQFDDDQEQPGGSNKHVCDDLQDIPLTYIERPARTGVERVSYASQWRLVKFRRSHRPEQQVGTKDEKGDYIEVVDAYYQTASVDKTTFLGIFFDTLIRFFLPGKPFKPENLGAIEVLEDVFGTGPKKPTPAVTHAVARGTNAVTFLTPTSWPT